MNGNYNNGNNGNEPRNNNGSATGKNVVLTKPSSLRDEFYDFDQPVVLRQSPVWARAAMLTIVGFTTFGIGWACIAELEEVVSAQGQLKPEGAVKEVQVPLNGVVEEVYVEDGDSVEENDVLFILDNTAAVAELQSLKTIRQSLSQENQFYRALMAESLATREVEIKIIALKLPVEIASLAKNRISLIEENQLFRAQLGIPGAEAGLNGQQLSRFLATRAEYNSRVAAARLEVEQLEKQLSQNQVQLRDAKERLWTDRLVLRQIENRNLQSLNQAKQSLQLEERILADISPLVGEGALADIQMIRQQQEVNDRRAALVDLESNGKIEYDQQKQQVETRLAEIEQLKEEEQRLQLNISQAREELTNTMAFSEKDLQDLIANNDKQIANLDSQLTKTVVENEKRIAEIDSQISRTEVTLKYQEVLAPVAGTVFDLQVGRGSVPNPNSADAALKIVPDDILIAEIFISNEDIGFVRQGTTVDVRITSFPFNEFGDIKGEVIWIGSDALEPDPIQNFYRFPAKVSLNKQYLEVADRKIYLQSGMSISTNLKIREHRKVISIFLDMFTKQIESLKQMR